MKRILLIVFLLSISFSTFANIVKVGTTTVVKPNTPSRPRSVVIAPTVYVDTDVCQLTISMVSGDSFTVYVYDGSGGVVYQGSVVTDGSRQVYLLPELEADLYSISIESNYVSHEGEFHVN